MTLPDLKWDDKTALGLSVAALVVLALLGLAARGAARRVRSSEATSDDALTVVAALVAATFGAQGMWGFLRATLHLPPVLAGLGFTLFELVMLVCALRARRTLLANGSAGPEGAMLWLFAVLAGFFSATHAKSWAEGLFRFIVPSIAAWLWHRLMKLEHRQLTGKLDGINWRVTPERILVRLGLAEPTARTTEQVSAAHALEALAIAVQRARSPFLGWGWPARRRVNRALRRAVQDAQLSTDEHARHQLRATLDILGSADALIRLTPVDPWSTPTTPDLEATFRDLAELDLLDVDERTRELLTRRSTTSTGARLTWSPPPLRVVAPPTQRPATGEITDQGCDHLVDDDHAGQGGEPDLTATMRATIIDASVRGVGERKIARSLKISRHQVRKVLADHAADPQPVAAH